MINNKLLKRALRCPNPPPIPPHPHTAATLRQHHSKVAFHDLNESSWHWKYRSFFSDKIHDILHYSNIFDVTNCIFLYALRLCIIIIINLEMKRIAGCLQRGIWFVSGWQKLYDWNSHYIACTCNIMMTSDTPLKKLSGTGRCGKVVKIALGGNRPFAPPPVAARTVRSFSSKNKNSIKRKNIEN